MARLAFDFGIAKSTVSDTIVWVENVLMQDDSFHLPGKQKRHTIKAQIIADVQTQEILCTAQAKGSVHDFQLFKVTVRALVWGILLLADSGYQGLLALPKYTCDFTLQFLEEFGSCYGVPDT